ncbi:MAG: putative Ig domain-containing protein, partial [Tannerella sp.]|nr:putative Ig domain-containing protein [Tannerella sp.]
MKNDFTECNHRFDSKAVKVKLAGAGYALLAAVWLCMTLLAPQPLSAQSGEAGNAKQAVGHQLYFGSFPQKYEGWNVDTESAMAAVPHVKKINYRAQAPKTWDDRDSFYVGYFSVQPVQWRVLADDAEGILLLSEHNLVKWSYHTTAATSVPWRDAAIRDSLEERFLEGGTSLGGGKKYFLPVEIGAVVNSTLQNPTLGLDPDGYTTPDDRVFLLSAADSSLYFDTPADRKATNTQYAASFQTTSEAGKADYWLLRTHSTSLFPCRAMWVEENYGYIDRTGVRNDVPALIRPALRLSRDRFVMLSGTKPAIGTRSNSLLDTDTDTMKLTLVDNSLDLNISGGDITADGYVSVQTGQNLINLEYTVPSGGGAGANDYISVLVEEQGGNVVYYSKLEPVPSAVSIPTALPLIPFNGAGLTDGAYTVKIFHEQVNTSTSEPDLASAPVVLSVGIVSGMAEEPKITTIEGTDDDLSDGWANIPYNDTIRFTGNSTPVLSIVAGSSLPPGLTLEPVGNLGILHGTPTTSAGSPFEFTVKALNGEGDSTQTYHVAIGNSEAPNFISPAAGMIDSVLRNFYIEVDTIEASGGPAKTFSVSSGKLPDGLSLDPVTGIIAGTPAKEEFAQFTVMASNALGNAFRDYQIKVKISNNPVAPVFVTTDLDRAEAGQPYSFKVQASGEPYPNFSILSGLPSSLSIHPGTGVISGDAPSDPPPPGTPYPVRIQLASTSGTTDQLFDLFVDHVLDPPHLTLTPPVTTVGTDPFRVTATFNVPVSGLIADHIDVRGGTGTVSSVVPATPVPATVWTFDVTPVSSIANGSVIETYIKRDAALSAEGVGTYAESDTVRVTFLSDLPVVQFGGIMNGRAFVSDPGG